VLNFIHRNRLSIATAELKNHAIVITIVVCSTALAEVVIFYIFGSPLKLGGATFVNFAIGFGYIALAIFLFINRQSDRLCETNNQNNH
jgi:hypothetical protein